MNNRLNSNYLLSNLSLFFSKIYTVYNRKALFTSKITNLIVYYLFTIVLIVYLIMLVEITASLIILYNILTSIFWSKTFNIPVIPTTILHSNTFPDIKKSGTVEENPIIKSFHSINRSENTIFKSNADSEPVYHENPIYIDDKIDESANESSFTMDMSTLNEYLNEPEIENTQQTNWWFTTIEWIEKTEDRCLEYLTTRSILVVSLFMNIILLLHYYFGSVSVSDVADNVSEYSDITGFGIMIL